MKELLEISIIAAIEAGKEIMKIYQGEDFEIEIKKDNSPLTAADLKSNEVIDSFLVKTGIPILSEESSKTEYPVRKHWQKCWLVDPLDGTKEFIKRNGEFTVNIGLLEQNNPVMGVVYAPVLGDLYFGTVGDGAYKYHVNIGDHLPDLDQIIQNSKKIPLPQKREELNVIGSRSHMSEETMFYVEKLKEKHTVNLVTIGSALKLCLIAEGSADVYPRFGPTMEWDTCAGHAIIIAAGYLIFKEDGSSPLEYNKKNLKNPYFIAGKPWILKTIKKLDS